MEEEQVNIKKIITTIDDEKSYSIDVDETTTFYEFKKILAGAAHLLKNCFRIYHGQKEYTNEYDDNTIQEMFPNLEEIPLRIISNKDVYEFEDELISVRFNINVPCDTHIGKYKMLYCFTCNKSICTDCFAQDHSNHKIEEKADYLAPAQLLMNSIFSNSSLYKADSRLSKYMDCVSFRSNLKSNIFNNLRKLIDELELKFASCLEYFSTSEDETEKNTNANLELLKKYCIECFIKLKNDINTKGIIIDDEIFLTLYRKLKEIERYKTELFEENKQKYEKLNTLLAPFIKQVETIYNEITITFNNYLNKDIYEIFKNSIQENIVEKIQKDQINDFMFRNIGVQRKSLNRMSLGNVVSYRKTGRNSFISPDKVLSNQKQEKNPFQKAVLSAQRQGQVTDSLFGKTNINSAKADKQNTISSYTYSKPNNQDNMFTKDLTLITEKNDINNQGTESGIYENKKIVTTTTTNIGKSTNTNTTGGLTMKSILNNNQNIQMNSISDVNNNINYNNIGNTQNIQKETTRTYTTTGNAYPGVTKYSSTQQEYSVHNFNSLPEINEIQGQKNFSTRTETITTTTTTTNNILGQNKNINNLNDINNNINTNINKNFSQGYEVTQYTTSTNQQKLVQSGTQQASSSNMMFGEKLVDVLSKEINKNQEANKNLINETRTEILGNNGEVIQRITKTETVEYNNTANVPFLFMYPVFNTNKMIGAIEEEDTERVDMDFKSIFTDKDLQLKEFPQGGAFCNSGKYFYFTGGQERQKGVGKIFLRVTIQQKNSQCKLEKMPSMINSHWNHTMIANDKYVFVVGGYNSRKCEYFNLTTLKWEAMPDLNVNERQRPILVIYKDYLYAFMGYSQFGILNSIERINIAKLGTSKWEKVSVSNPHNLNLKFFGAGIYIYNNEIYFIGGKLGHGNDESDYKNDVYIFSFDGMEFNSYENSLTGQLNFIENEFHHCGSESIGNFIDYDGGCLASIGLTNLISKPY